METSHSLGKALSMEGRDIRLTQQVGFTDSVLGQVSTGSRSRPSPDGVCSHRDLKARVAAAVESQYV